ncbi:whey acidic protein-like [Rana temporaria]|uniref:whey acidic protein-like n=1 Tax=Rana temporaria TaxID=8407 RepID=UPI001AACFA92|nr:whey acidic protein-like [Rana temporaria]
MMRTTQIFFILGLLLPLCVVVTSFSIKKPGYAQKPGTCPPERYYIKASNPDIIHNFCHSDDYQCKNNMKCCSDNLHMICKPPAQAKPGQCPTFDSSLTSATKCNDNCTSDSECPGSYKCCTKFCGKTCVPTLSDMGKPAIATSQGFCPQEALYKCAQNERKYCDESSCLDGYKCCPLICRVECRQPVKERNGACPANAACPAGENKSCLSDNDCKTFHKCCSTSCGQRCLHAVNGTFNVFDPTNTHLFDLAG